MARFTANAVYNAKRPDGSAIIDLLGGRAEEKPAETEDQQRGNINLSVVFSPQILPEGGGQTSTITATVTDKAGKPVKDADVWFFATALDGVGESDRRAQLSQFETTTNASGKAVVTYTTVAADDKKIVEINAGAHKNNVDVHKHYKILATNQAAVISGVVRDPYTGAPKGGVTVHVRRDGVDHSFDITETDAQGYYSALVPTGTYSVSFEMAIRDQITVNASGHGKTYTVDNNKGILKGVVTGAGSGKMVMALAPDFRHSPDAWTLQANIQSDGSFVLALAPGTYELFVVGSSNPSKTGITVQSGDRKSVV